MEEGRRQVMEAQPSSGLEGIGLAVEAGGGGVVKEMVEEGQNQEGGTHRDWQGH